MKGRVFNHSSASILVLVARPTERWLRLLAGAETAEHDDALMLRAEEPDATIMGERGWRLNGAVAHVIDDRRGLRVVGTGCTPADVIPDLPVEKDHPLLPQRPWVTVLGAGIAGLTAAHELIDRGFRVQVVEKNHGSPTDEDDERGYSRGLGSPDVGGIARTQWSTAPLGNGSAGPQRAKSIHGDGDWYGPDPEKWNDWKAQSTFAVPFTVRNEIEEAGLEAKLDAWLKHSNAVAALQIVIVIYRSEGGGGEVDGPAAGYERFATFSEWLQGHPLPKLAEAFPVARIEIDGPAPTTEFPGLLVRHHEHLGLIAGEHGFRFFPGFYRHVRDTMQRTPIYDATAAAFSTRTAHDNLTEVRLQAIEDPTRKQGTAFLREKFSTVGAMVKQYQRLRADLGYRPSDLLRFMLRIARYITSSSERRAQCYEDISWWDFLSLRHLPRGRSGPDAPRLQYGERFERAIRHSPEALVAMKSDIADARTQGNISVQLTMDQFDLHDQTDSTLNGPTSESWFRHWREYLEQQGVSFFVGEVTSIDAGDHGAQVAIAFPGGITPDDFFGPMGGENHYYVCAMDAPSVARVTRKLSSARTPCGTIMCIADITARAPEDITPPQDEQLPFQVLTGLQLYYRARVAFDAAHIYYADSAWGLSAISQIRYWGAFGTGGRYSRLLGNLSIDIGSWRPRAGSALRAAPDPNDCTPSQIASETILQITDGRSNEGPMPAFFHLDDYIQFSHRPGRDGQTRLLPTWNRAPFLINVVSGWQRRPPGDPWSPSDERLRPRLAGDAVERDGVWQHRRGGYQVYFSNLVFAGAHMRTFTRMGTMESANESARHAVNALLDHLAARRATPSDAQRSVTSTERLSTPFGDYCEVWDPEEHEFDDVDFLRRIDKYLVTAAPLGARPSDDVVAGRGPKAPPHLFDLLNLDRLPDLIESDEDSKRIFDLLGESIEILREVSRPDSATFIDKINSLRSRFVAVTRR